MISNCAWQIGNILGHFIPYNRPNPESHAITLKESQTIPYLMSIQLPLMFQHYKFGNQGELDRKD